MTSPSDDARTLKIEEALQLTAEIVTAYLSNNSISADDVPSIIRSVHATLEQLSRDGAATHDVNLRPAVPIKKSITPEYIICLEDGRKLTMLKRYLRTRYGLSPEEYRQKWGLPIDYPMVAPNYAQKRSEFAKKIGLGRGGRPRVAVRRGRPKKS